MKAVYKCESCGKYYDSEQEAVGCENKHAAEVKRRKKAAEEKNARLKEIQILVQKFVDDYGEHPCIRIKRRDLKGRTYGRLNECCKMLDADDFFNFLFN